MTDDRIALARPDLAGNESRYVEECLRSGWISSIGHFIGEFESGFAAAVGTKHAVATNNGTTALHLALVALGVGPGDEVIVPTVTYVATANAVAYCGATPVLADVEPGTLTIDPESVVAKLTGRTKGIIPVHLYGIPADMAALDRIAQEHGLFLLEDAAEAHGAAIGTQIVGSMGQAGVFSFFGNKIMTTGEGGAVVTDDDELAARLRLHRGQGMDPDRRYWFPVIGYNYRMTNIQAALGLAQLERLDEMTAIRRRLEDVYRAELAAVSAQVEVTSAPPGMRSVPWLQNVYLRTGGAERRDAVMARLDAAGVDSRPVFIPMHQLPPYLEQSAYPVADDWSARGLSLPLHTGLSESDVARVCRALAEALIE